MKTVRPTVLVAAIAVAIISSVAAVLAWRASARSSEELTAIRKELEQRSATAPRSDVARAPERSPKPPPIQQPGESEQDRRLAALAAGVRAMNPPLVRSAAEADAVAAFLLTLEGFRSRTDDQTNTVEADSDRVQLQWMHVRAREEFARLPLDDAGRRRLLDATPGLAEFLR